jgi:hypothetical protein
VFNDREEEMVFAKMWCTGWHQGVFVLLQTTKGFVRHSNISYDKL